jgi:hypothetical protein
MAVEDHGWEVLWVDLHDRRTVRKTPKQREEDKMMLTC